MKCRLGTPGLMAPPILHSRLLWVNRLMEQAVAGTIHNVMLGNLDTEFHSSLLENTDLLERVASRNAELNANGERTYPLSQVILVYVSQTLLRDYR